VHINTLTVPLDN